MIGKTFELDIEGMRKVNACTNLGWKFIKVIDKHLSFISKCEKGHSIFNYGLVIEGWDEDSNSKQVAEILLDDLMEEMSYGIYKSI